MLEQLMRQQFGQFARLQVRQVRDGWLAQVVRGPGRNDVVARATATTSDGAEDRLLLVLERRARVLEA